MSTFLYGADAVWLDAYLRSNGAPYVDHLESGFKERAKTLSRALDQHGVKLGLMRVQEAVAKALGFANTHALQQLFASFRAGPKLEESASAWEAWLTEHKTSVQALLPLFDVTRTFTGVTPMDEGCLEFMASVTAHVAKHLETPLPLVRDAAAAAWAQETDWERLTTRTPLNSKLEGPLVTFLVEGDLNSRKSEGRFQLTTAAHWLWDNVIGSDPDSQPRKPPVAWVRNEFNTAMALAQKHPEFLIPWAAAAGLMERHTEALNGHWSEVHRLYENGIKETEKLIPKGFKGTINWYDTDNRAYLRTLHAMMVVCLCTKWGEAKALTYANKMLRLCPGDNMGVRSMHPLLLARRSSSAKAFRDSVATALDTGGPSGKLHAGLALLFRSDPPGLEHFLEGVFSVPEFATGLLNDDKVRPFRRQFNRRPVVGYTNPWEVFPAASAALREYKPMGAWTSQVLRDKELLAAEEALERMLDEPKPGDYRATWRDEAAQAARRLAPALLQRYPLPEEAANHELTELARSGAFASQAA